MLDVTHPLSLIHAQLVYELVMVRDGVFSLSDQNFTNALTNAISRPPGLDLRSRPKGLCFTVGAIFF